MTTTEHPATQQAISPLATLRQIEQELNLDFLEREDAIRAVFVSLLSKSHMVILGPPGSAKSDLVNCIASRFGLSFFVYLMTRFTTPDEVFGPISVDGLKLGTYERITTGKAPRAEIIFLDEVFKSSSAILNTFLTMQQERQFDNGVTRQAVPLVSMFGASNEMPQGDDLAAAWDRYLLRLDVGYLADSNFERLLTVKANPQSRTGPTSMQRAELVALQAQAHTVLVPPALLSALVSLRKELKDEKGIIASDRRWTQCLGLIKAQALLEGRQTAEEDDLSILAHALWNRPEERQEIAKKIGKLANPFNARAQELKDQAAKTWTEALEALKQYPGEDENSSLNQSRIVVTALKKINKTRDTLEAEKKKAAEQGRSILRMEQALRAILRIREEAVAKSGL